MLLYNKTYIFVEYGSYLASLRLHLTKELHRQTLSSIHSRADYAA